MNILRGLTVGQKRGFVNILEPGGHTRWARGDGETFPSVRKDWLLALGDFGTIFR